jgi:hypothetical protein
MVAPISGIETSRRTSRLKCVEEANLPIQLFKAHSFADGQGKTATIRHM